MVKLSIIFLLNVYFFNNFNVFDMKKTLIEVAAIAAMGISSVFVTINVIEFVFSAMERHSSR
jgi:hypothetical protein